MAKISALEKKLKRVCLSPKQREVFCFWLETNGWSNVSNKDLVARLYPSIDISGFRSYVGGINVQLGKVAEKLSMASELSEPEQLILSEIDKDVGLAITLLNNGCSKGQLIQQLINQRKWHSHASLEKRLNSLVFNAREQEAMEVVLGWRGEYNGWYDYIRKEYFGGKASAEQIAPIHWTLKVYRRDALEKIRIAFDLGLAYQNLLIEISSLHARIFALYSSVDELETQIKRFRNTRVRQKSAAKQIYAAPKPREPKQSEGSIDQVLGPTDQFRQDMRLVPLEKLKQAIVQLPDKDQTIIHWILGWEKQEIKTQLALAPVLGIRWTAIHYRIVSARKKLGKLLAGEGISETVWWEKEKKSIKQALLKARKSSAWGCLTEIQQERLTLYYGLDLEGDRSRTARQVADQLGILQGSLMNSVYLAKAKLAGLDSSLGLMVSSRVMPSEKQQMREKLLLVRQGPHWPYLLEHQKKALNAYYKLDLPNERMRSQIEAAQYLGVTLNKLKQWLDAGKRKLNKLSPFLELPVSQVKSAQKTGEQKVKDKYLGSLNIYRKEILAVPELSDDEVAELLPQAKAGDQAAQNKLYRASLRYVLGVAYGYTYSYAARLKSFVLQDFIQEGNIGLLNAVRNCQFEPGNDSWIGYVKSAARYAIKSSLSEAPNQSLISIPAHRQTQIRKYIKAEMELYDELGRQPEIQEIAEALEESIEVAQKIKEAMRVYYSYTVSLQEPRFVNDVDNDDTWADTIAAPSDDFKDPDKAAERLALQWTREHIDDLFAKILNEREEYILKLSFGFDEDPYQDDKIAQKTGTTLREIQDIREVALGKLRSYPEVSNWLKHLT